MTKSGEPAGCGGTRGWVPPPAHAPACPHEEETRRLITRPPPLPASDLYESNKTFCAWLANGFLFKR
ncbi:hypothetical protein M8371_24255, partial [Klebsiella pneumoniae]|nr:hypothetical protein [Klebsiella pneumoniae]